MIAFFARIRVALTLACILFATGAVPGSRARQLTLPLDAPPLEASVDRSASVRIVARDDHGGAVEGATVDVFSIVDRRAWQAGRATTDRQGRATVASLPPGEAWVRVEADGRGRATSHVSLDGLRELEFTLPRESSFDVEVRSPEGAPIAGAVIEARGAEPMPLAATTDEAGHARVGRLGAGPFRWQVRANGWDASSGRARDGERVSVTLRRLGSITVTVIDPEGAPRPSASVQIAGSALWPARKGVTGPRGGVRLAGLYAGSYSLRATANDLVSATELAVTLGAGEDKSIDLRLARGRIVHVRVVDGDDAASPPIAAARVVLTEAGVSPFPLEGVSDVRGEASIGPVAAGPALVTARAEGFVPAAPISLDDLERTSGVVSLHRAAKIEGRVVDARGFPVAGARLEVIGTDFQGGPIADDPARQSFRDGQFDALVAGPASLVPAGELGVVPGKVPPIPLRGAAPAPGPTHRAQADPWVTSRDGTFTLSPVTPGRIRVVARHPEYVDALSDALSVQSGGVQQGVEIVVRAGGTVEGRVLSAEGRPAAGARVELLPSRGGIARATLTASDGTFTFEAVSRAASIDVFESDEELQPSARVDVAVAEGSRTRVTLTLPPARQATTVTIRDDRGYPLPAAQISMASLDAAIPLRQTVFTDARGDATLRACVGLPARLDVRAAGHAPLTTTTAKAPAQLTLTLAPELSVTGEIRSARTREGVAATVALYTDQGVRTVSAGSDGTFSARELAPGPARIVVRAAGYVTLDRALSLDATSAGRPRDLGRFELATEAVARGVVVDGRGSPVQGARVARGRAPRFLQAGALPPGVAVTDAKGAFELGGLPEGDVSIEAWAADVGTGRVSTRAAAGRTSGEVRIVLDASAGRESEALATGGVAVTLGETGGESPEVVIVEVAPGSEAEHAGLAPDDTLVSVDATRVSSMQQARGLLSGPRERDVIVDVMRQGRPRRLRVPREPVRR